MKKKISLIFVSIFLMLGIVCGALVFNADTLFLQTSTEEVEEADEEKDEQTRIQASGNWVDYWSGSNRAQLNWTGSGSSTRIHIYNAVDLMDFMCQVNDTATTWWTKVGDGVLIREATVLLESDIDLSAHYWTPIGNGNGQFKGTFDGQGHTISGLTIYKTSSEIMNSIAAYDGKYGIGLFGVVNNATITDFTLQGGEFYINTNSASIKVRMGGVVGMTIDSASVTISSVTNNMTRVELAYTNAKDSYIGGIVGLSYGGEINNCFNFSKVYGRSNTTIGGIAGALLGDGYFTSCGNFGEVEGWLTSASSTIFDGFGGIVGFVGTSLCMLEDCVNYGYIHATSSTSYQSMNVGGVIGCGAYGVGVNRCINYGKVSGTAYVGGVAGCLGFWYLGRACVLMNSVNYGEVNGSQAWGKLCGTMVGTSDSIKGCSITGTVDRSDRIGVWQDYNGNSISWNGSNIDYWETYHSNNHFKASFFKNHSYDFSGNVNGYFINGWKYIPVTLNGGGSYGWVVTTLIYDQFSYSGKTTEYKYSLVPYSLIGTATLNTRYARSGSTAYDFDNDSYDKQYMRITFKSVTDNDSVEDVQLSYNNAKFYYITGRNQVYSNSSLKFNYNASLFKFKSVSSNPSGLSATMISDTNVTSTSRTNYISFNSKRNSSITFNVVFQSQPKQLNFVYKIARHYEAPESAQQITGSAHYEYYDLNTSYLSEFFTQSSTTTNYYYKQTVNHTVTPNKGYAVLSIINRDSGNANDLYDETPTAADGSDYLIDSRSVCNTHYIVASVASNTGTSKLYEMLNPSNFGVATTNYKYLYDTSTTNRKQLVIYIVPIRYQNINVSLNKVGTANNTGSTGEVVGEVNNNLSEPIYAFKGEGGVYLENGKARSISKDIKLFNKSERGSKTAMVNSIESDLLRFGYKYTLYGLSYDQRSSYENEEGTLMSSISNNGSLQLDNERSIKFSMQDLLNVAIPNNVSEYIANRCRAYLNLHIVVKRTEIPYVININNKVNSYRETENYKTNNSIGGTNTIVMFAGGNAFKVNHSAPIGLNPLPLDYLKYSFTPKAGYKSLKIKLYTDTESVNGNVFDSTVLNIKQSQAPENYNTNTERFHDLLDEYMAKIGNDVSRLSKDSSDNYILNIYVYYSLQQYSVTFKAEVDGSQRSANYTFTPTNFASAQTKNSYTNSSATGTTYYYAPVTLKVNNVNNGQQNVKFLGWYMGNNLLSLESEYKFVLNPEYATGRITNINTNESNYSFNLVARFASYTTASGNLQTAGNKIVYINNANDLVLLSQNVNSGTTYEGYVIKQTANIDMKDIIFNPLGTEANPFRGTYDGQNYIISNLKFVFNDNYLQNLYNVGLFGYTNGATIKNLTIRNSDFKAFGKAGIFAAEAYNTTFNYLNNFNSDLSLSKVTFFDIYGGEVSSKTLNYAKIGGSLPVDISSVNSTSFTWNTELYPLARANYGGLVGSMTGGSAFACSVNASLTKDRKDGNVDVSNFQGLVGSLSSSGKIDQCCAENSANNSELTVANTTNNNVTNSYYRYSNTTKYVGTSLSGSNPTNTNIWFRLANGNWALRVLYWS